MYLAGHHDLGRSCEGTGEVFPWGSDRSRVVTNLITLVAEGQPKTHYRTHWVSERALTLTAHLPGHHLLRIEAICRDDVTALAGRL